MQEQNSSGTSLFGDKVWIVPVSEYNRLVRDSKELDLLHAAGVENWEGYQAVPVPEYNRLVRDSKELDLLYAAGVENWEGYQAAFENMEEQEEEK